MSSTFSQTTRALAVDRPRRSIAALLVALALAAAWGTWFVRAPITVHETSEAGRIEVSDAAHSVDAPVGARVAAVLVVLGQEVREGDVVVELDAESERRSLAEERARLATLPPQIEALRRQLAAYGEALVDDREATVTALAQARARLQEADVQEKQTADEAARAAQLFQRGAISEIEASRARADDATRRAQVDALGLEVGRLEREQRTRDSERRGRAEDLRRDLASLEGEQERSQAAIDRLDHEIAKRTVRAPLAGRIGELGAFREGAFVREGERLAVVVPTGRLRAVGDFAPEAALGRIRPGQAARLRLQGFSWMQYGTVAATVTSVASELRDGKVRVELALDPDPSSRIPLQHGLPGSIEVDVERTTPARLALRAAGTLLAARAGAATP